MSQLRSRIVAANHVHNNGQGEIRTKIIATIRSEWQPYTTSQTRASFAQQRHHDLVIDSSPDLPVEVDAIEFPYVLEHEHRAVIFSHPMEVRVLLSLILP